MSSLHTLNPSHFPSKNPSHSSLQGTTSLGWCRPISSSTSSGFQILYEGFLVKKEDYRSHRYFVLYNGRLEYYSIDPKDLYALFQANEKAQESLRMSPYEYALLSPSLHSSMSSPTTCSPKSFSQLSSATEEQRKAYYLENTTHLSSTSLLNKANLRGVMFLHLFLFSDHPSMDLASSSSEGLNMSSPTTRGTYRSHIGINIVQRAGDITLHGISPTGHLITWTLHASTKKSLEKWTEKLKLAMQPKWQTNTEVCQICSKVFSWRLRRHHCRACGTCICSNCASLYVSSDAVYGEIKSEHLFNPSDSLSHESLLICNDCVPNKTKKRHILNELKIGSKILLYGKYIGFIRYLRRSESPAKLSPKTPTTLSSIIDTVTSLFTESTPLQLVGEENLLLGIEMLRTVHNGTNGEPYFTCENNKGLLLQSLEYIEPYTEHVYAANKIKAWMKKCLAYYIVRARFLFQTWKLLSKIEEKHIVEILEKQQKFNIDEIGMLLPSFGYISTDEQVTLEEHESETTTIQERSPYVIEFEGVNTYANPHHLDFKSVTSNSEKLPSGREPLTCVRTTSSSIDSPSPRYVTSSRRNSSQSSYLSRMESFLSFYFVSPSYHGVHLHFPLRTEMVINLTEQFRNGILLDRVYVYLILYAAQELLEVCHTKAVSEISLPKDVMLIIVGDLHGQLDDLLTIFHKYGFPCEKRWFLFNGDYVDRGRNGVEVITLILCWKLLYPTYIYINRGNHECRLLNRVLGFEEEIYNKYGDHNEIARYYQNKRQKSLRQEKTIHNKVEEVTKAIKTTQKEIEEEIVANPVDSDEEEENEPVEEHHTDGNMGVNGECGDAEEEEKIREITNLLHKQCSTYACGTLYKTPTSSRHASQADSPGMSFSSFIESEEEMRRLNELFTPENLFRMFSTTFDLLPPCAIIQSRIFVTHGGLPRKGDILLEDIERINYRREPPLHIPASGSMETPSSKPEKSIEIALDSPTASALKTGYTSFEDEIFIDLLWSDPRDNGLPENADYIPSARGAGAEFSKNITKSFMKANDLSLIIRSHECHEKGYAILHDGSILSCFSASSYCGSQCNEGAIVSLNYKCRPEILTHISALPASHEFHAKWKLKCTKLQECIFQAIHELILAQSSTLYRAFVRHNRKHIKKFFADDKYAAYYISKLQWIVALQSVLQVNIPFLHFLQDYCGKPIQVDEMKDGKDHMCIIYENQTYVNYIIFMEKFNVRRELNRHSLMQQSFKL